MLRAYLPTVQCQISYSPRIFEDLKKRVSGGAKHKEHIQENTTLTTDDLHKLVASFTNILHYNKFVLYERTPQLEFPESWDFDLALNAVKAPLVVYSDYIPFKTKREVKELSSCKSFDDAVVVLWNQPDLPHYKHVICLSFTNAQLLNDMLDVFCIPKCDSYSDKEITHSCTMRKHHGITMSVTRHK